MLDLNDVSVTFHAGTVNERKALDHVSLHLDRGEFVCVLGTNGAGKSTLLNAVSGTLSADSGTITLDGMDLTRQPEHKRARYIGRLFQDPMKGTAPDMSIVENLGLAYSRGKRMTLSRAIQKKDRQLFHDRLSQLGLGLEDRMNQPVGLLSGGQRQALTLLMATIVTPKLLLLDEHTAALDPNTAAQVMKLTDQIIHENQITTLMITHNLRQALEYGTKTLIMNEGKIVRVLEGEEKKQTSVEELLQMYDFV
ncbi:MAG TPA: ATP-binding cassette domain-containing protein [Candidatus Merdibacter merdavium]|uniref:ATP-binding cassette domain-containing protein n=1 Tax=Candidatus Merdibacter merdavium TaxID=2838692 RepID=A0A9D2NRT7_9FIRM|nr:ATP-binding cassette domain-containing protein [Candidatus Merdibacter merdipullorum]HJC35583.1 ATP-binding cassette domain-containing protein [Candidatus Merdibacter merdavium]